MKDYLLLKKITNASGESLFNMLKDSLEAKHLQVENLVHCKLKWFVEEPEKVLGVDAQGEPLRFFLRTIFNGSLEEPTLKQILWFFNEPVCLVKGSSKEPFLNIR